MEDVKRFRGLLLKKGQERGSKSSMVQGSTVGKGGGGTYRRCFSVDEGKQEAKERKA